MTLARWPRVNVAPEPASDASESVEQVVDRLRELATVADGEKPRAVQTVSDLLAWTEAPPIVRNAAAFALTDLIGQEATGPIVRVLRRMGVGTAAGSLLFALNDVGASLPLDLIVDMVATGSLEAQGEAITFLEDARVDPFSVEDQHAATRRLDGLRAQGGPDAIAKAAELAREYLDELAPRR